jgi:hypothetical protein
MIFPQPRAESFGGNVITVTLGKLLLGIENQDVDALTVAIKKSVSIIA